MRELMPTPRQAFQPPAMSLLRALTAAPVLLALGACKPTIGGLPPAGSGQVVIVAGVDGPNMSSGVDVDWNGSHDACLACLLPPPGLMERPGGVLHLHGEPARP